VLASAVGSAVALAAAGLLMSGLATAGSDDHGPGHSTSPDGSMVHDGVTYYAGPVPDAIPADVLAAAEPTAIAIPSIGVGSELLDLGLQPDGSAEVPADYALAGWYREGGRPGVIGPTIVLGHVDSTDGPAVFYRLRDLTPGDVVEVTTADGTVATYSVDRVEQVSKDEFPTFEVFGATQDDVLRLVTCAGEFDRGARSYQDNLVVHGSRIG
jgi:LPXTG-site transpeptidase (sortase) family protein